jgi:eight-cysteine-cluster-containing protein
MKKILFVFVAMSVCGKVFAMAPLPYYLPPQSPQKDPAAFCGSSTYASCSSDSDCSVGGCSVQLCKGKSQSMVTTCEVRDCYSAGDYGTGCACANHVCQWAYKGAPIKPPPPKHTNKNIFRWSINLHPEDVHYNIWDTKKALGAIEYIGAQMVRFDIAWSDIEPVQGRQDAAKWKFYEDLVSAAQSYGLEPIVVLARQPQWAINLYRNNPAAYWNACKGYIKAVACRLGQSIHYYQISNESNTPDDPINAGDDWKKFAGIRDVIASCDRDFETIVNVYSNWVEWEPALTDWLKRAGKDIDIIGIDHYPSTFTFTSGAEWFPLDRLISRINDPNDAWYGKKGAIVETGYSTWSGMNAHGEWDQQNWIDNYAFKTIMNKVKANNQNPAAFKIVFANFYELYDQNSGSWFCPDRWWFGCSFDIKGLANDHFGILHTDGTEKTAINSLKNYIDVFYRAVITAIR